MKWKYIGERTSKRYAYSYDHREAHVLESPDGILFVISSVKNAYNPETNKSYTETILVQVDKDLKLQDGFWSQRKLLDGVWDSREALKQWGIEVDFPDKENG